MCTCCPGNPVDFSFWDFALCPSWYFSLPSEGNLLLLNEALAKHETFFIRCGIFLILEKLKIITYRNLFKKV